MYGWSCGSSNLSRRCPLEETQEWDLRGKQNRVGIDFDEGRSDVGSWKKTDRREMVTGDRYRFDDGVR